jgi:NADH-quinone oxidoreductase subunit M
MPMAMFGFVVGGLVSMGMPGFSGFVAEIPIYLGAWKTYPLSAIIAAISIVVTAAYILLVVRKVFFGEPPAALASGVPDITLRDKAVIVGLSLIMMAVGLVPSLLTPAIQAGVNHIMALLGGA